MGEYVTSKHAPPHYFHPGATHIITACTYQRKYLLNSHKKYYFLQTLFDLAEKLEWCLDAWVVLDNHYHIITKAPDEFYRITDLIQPLHSLTAKRFNQYDQASGRRIWQNYWDTCLTNQKSYLARMHYVLLNPVKHGVVNDPADYPFSSYRWFVGQAEPEFRERVLNTPTTRVHIRDDF